MFFHSIPYFCFLPLVVFALSLFKPANSTHRWKVLVAASLFFYGWLSPWALPYLALVIVVSYFVGRQLEVSNTHRLALLWAAITLFILTIATTKYVLPKNFLVPIGLSFYSFQAIGYLIDVYRRNRKFENHFGTHTAFICFFPTLLSGPIERAESLIPQIQNPSRELANQKERHLLLFYAGLFKKLVIADALAKFVTPVFQYPEYFSGFTLFFGIAIARYMIFADFSGYADMAVASAGLLGIKIRQNFMRPFFSTSLIEYWRRWHISLHDWMKDYVFFSLSVTPIGRTLGIYFCLIISFLFMGIWHDVGPTFLAVGLWHGVFISLDYMTRDTRDRWARRIGLADAPLTYRLLQIVTTFVFFVMPPTVFFLSKNMDVAKNIFTRIFEGDWSANQIANSFSILSGGDPSSILFLCRTLAAVIVVEALHMVQANTGSLRDRVLALPVWARGLLYVGLFVILIVFGQTFGERPYVYFQF